MSDSELYEEYGYKAHDKGLFLKWRNLTSSIVNTNPEIKLVDAAEKAYFELVGSKE